LRNEILLKMLFHIVQLHLLRVPGEDGLVMSPVVRMAHF